MRKYFLVGGAIVVGIMLGFYIHPLISGDNIFQQVKKLEYVLNTAAKNYVDEVDTQKLTEAAIRGMLGELDVHSVYISAEEQKKVEEDFKGSFDGIGVQFDIESDTITVVTPIPGGPSEKLGILSRDKIVKIDGVNAVGMNRDDVPRKLKGPKGTFVKVEIKRAGEKNLITYDIERDKIPINTVDASFIIDGTDIGVITVNRFAQTTHDEMMDSLRALKALGMKKLILDLRGNPGGLLNQAYLMSDEFTKMGDTIVYTKGRKSAFDECYISRGGTEFAKIPLVVLVNAGSASASEIVSGSLQDLDRALIVGETSYGKGLVQRPYEIGDGSVFRLTIAHYYTPSGRCIQRPYKDKDKYRHLAGRLNLEEGSYIDDALAKIKAQVFKINDTTTKADQKINIDSLPLYKTKFGRTVFGGGGITPDYIVNLDTLTKLGVELRKNNIFYDFIRNYMDNKGKELRNKYKNDFDAFYHKFDISDATMKEFRALAEKKEIKWDEKSYQTDKDFIKVILKCDIAQFIWSRSRQLQIFSVMDKQLNKASELFPEAIRVARLNK